MTGYESKKAAARDKLDDDDALTIAYQSGYYDGKKAALPAQEPVAWMYQCTVDNSEPVLLRKKQNWAESGTGLWVETPLSTTPPQRTEQCNYPDCKCPTENPCLKGLAQPAQEPVAWLHPANPTCVTTDPTAYARGIPLYTTPPQPVQEPVAHLCGPDENGLFGLPTADKACKDCFPVYRQLPQRPWVGLTEEDLKLLSAEWRIVYGAWMDDFARDIETKLKELNHG